MLSDYTNQKTNNYTLIRLIFASLVLFGHSFPVAGNGADPISSLLLPSAWIGSVAVGGFFAISGFLVTASFAHRGPLTFISARALRLYPAVIAYSAVMIFILGPAQADVSIKEYFASGPWSNLRNALLWQWNHNLPHVFTSNPIPGSTNGSGWTLPLELRCYILIFLLGFMGTFEKRFRANAVLIVLLYSALEASISMPLFGEVGGYRHPLIFFLIGSMAWVNRHYIPVNASIALVLIGATALSFGTHLFFVTHALCITYVIFVAAYRLKHINIDRYGDISYGVYLYAWPIQQSVWVEGQSAYINAMLSTIIVVPLAYTSWRLVERPCLGLRRLLDIPDIRSSLFMKLRLKAK